MSEQLSPHDFLSDKPQEKCGVVGVLSTDKYAPIYARHSLSALQHRGQESAGMTVAKKTRFKSYVGMGLIPHVLTDAVLKDLGKSTAAIAHNRYSTTGSSSLNNAQPITVKKRGFRLSIAHNGNIPDLTWLIKQVKHKHAATSDTGLIASLLIEQRPQFSSWEETFIHIFPHIKGAYSLTVLTEDGSIYAVRDVYGIRPLCFGQLPTGWVIASESVALDIVNAAYVREVKQGEIIKFAPDKTITSYFLGEPKRRKLCLFEHIYFARPDSFISGLRMRRGREESGRRLGMRIKKKQIPVDVVVPVFDSGYPAAKGVAQFLGLPLIEAITTSHYVGRTFIRPGQKNRTAAVNGKHSFTPDEIAGKRVLFVDDSAVRLTTSRVMVHGLRKAGAVAVYAGLASPPIVNHCDLGIDMKSKNELPASQWAGQPLSVIEKNITKLIGADEVIYLPIEETTAAMNGTEDMFYHTPFGGPHPIRDDKEVFSKREVKHGRIPRLCIFVSGNGTNLQEIIDQVSAGAIHAKIAGVIANTDCYALERTRHHTIPTAIVSSVGKLKDPEKRKVFEKDLIEAVLQFSPDLIVLAGWMPILGEQFLKKMQQSEIPVINLHPALLTTTGDASVYTSRGKIPVLRGAHAIKEAYERNLPVSGITIHQVLAGNDYDTGPIILKEEVRRNGEAFVEWEQRIHQAEHRALPTAIKRVLHVLQADINIADGKFPW